MISRINSAVLNGLDVVATEVEVGFSRGIPGIVIVGLPDNAVKESRERLKLAVSQANFDYPQATKIVINLSPADVRKEGSALDLPMAVGIVKNRYRMESPAFCRPAVLRRAEPQRRPEPGQGRAEHLPVRPRARLPRHRHPF